MGAAGAVDADQHLLAAPIPVWQLRQRGTDDGLVVGHGVRAGVADAEQERQRLAGALGAVIDERPQRMEAEPALDRRRRGLLLRVRGDQGGVHVDDQR
jgi:hypothetical protein